MSMFRRTRMNLARYGSRLIKRVSRVPPLFAILGRVREFPIVRPGTNAVSAASVPAPLSRSRRRPWQAMRAGGHTGPNYIAQTVRGAEKARPADYPDLPEISRNGAELAKERNEPRLRFAARWGLAEGVDLAITMAALHYARSGQGFPWRALESRIIFS